MPLLGAGYLGDFSVGATVRFIITTVDSTGAPAATAGGGLIVRVYKDANNTESSSGLTVTESWDGQAGQHLIEVDLSANAVFYAAGSDFFVLNQSGSIGGVALGPAVAGRFSIKNRSTVPITGDGDIPVDHNTGGADTLLYRVNGVAADNVIIKSYLRSEYDAGTRTVRGTTYTGPDGRWINPLMLSAGNYVLIARLPGVSDAVRTNIIVS